MTAALEGGEWSVAPPAALYPRERPGIHCTAGWVGPGPVWTDGKSRLHRDSIPDRLARSSVTIPTELPGPLGVEGRKQTTCNSEPLIYLAAVTNRSVTDSYVEEKFVFFLAYVFPSHCHVP